MSDNTVDSAMRERVLRQLKEVEQRYGVRVLYACESGSRGWGFASPDSDYDVRFLYVHPPEWYLRVEAQRDVIELPEQRIIILHQLSLSPARKRA